MKIGVLSDTHGVKYIAEKAVDKMEDVNILLHAGDLVEDASHLEGKNYRVYCVAGNCDVFSLEPSEKLLELQGKKILLTHGHTYRVKRGYEKLLAKAKEASADIVVFGHTHILENIYINGILFFNPGSAALPKNGGPGTYGIIEIADGQIKTYINTI